MKRFILILVTALFFFFSCDKKNCKERQSNELKQLTEQFQRDLSNTNLTDQQIQVLKARFDEKQKQILSECN